MLDPFEILRTLYFGCLYRKPDALVIFLYLFDEADPSGLVDINAQVIADAIGLSIDEVRSAVAELESLDPLATTIAGNGALIERIDGHRDWGWRIVNTHYFGGLRGMGSPQPRTQRASINSETLGFVYLLHNQRTSAIKIGFSINPKHREKTLQSEEPEIRLIGYFPGTMGAERELHRRFQANRIRGEWFKLDIDTVNAILAEKSKAIESAKS